MFGSTRRSSGPVHPLAGHRVAHRPVTRGAITAGLWAERRRINRDVSVPQAWDRLHAAGNFANLELAAGTGTGSYTNDLPFLDSDVYKWLEAIGWTLADPDLTAAATAQLQHYLEESCRLLEAAQEPDGYLDSNFQVRTPGRRWHDLQWGHELYCAGHLIQAAVALHRTSGDDRLLRIARRLADLLVATFGVGEGQVDGVCGHPEVETALVELYRETDERSYLRLARYFVDRRGAGLLGDDRFGRPYWQDHLPVREAPTVEGHSVRQLYLLAGVADVYVEDGDDTLLKAAVRLWHEMVATKTYLTGGIGSHHSDEAFGDAYELPNERSYCETCAAIASIMFSWRMLMITGEARYADLLERTLYNGFLGGLSLDGRRYIYANPLQVRDGHVGGGTDQEYTRREWFRCACCPPNVMRTLASLEHYVVLAGDDEVRLHQFIPGVYGADLVGGEVVLRVETDYPWSGRVTATTDAVPGGAWGLTLRIPQWAGAGSLSVNGEPVDVTAADGWVRVDREWSAGDTLVLELPLQPRFVRADPRVDATRGCVALEYGPLVYALESVDNPGHRLDDVVVDPTSAPVVGPAVAALGGVPVLQVRAAVREHDPAWWPYPVAGAATATPTTAPAMTTLQAVPYYAWGNRTEGAMRVWVPAG